MTGRSVVVGLIALIGVVVAVCLGADRIAGPGEALFIGGGAFDCAFAAGMLVDGTIPDGCATDEIWILTEMHPST